MRCQCLGSALGLLADSMRARGGGVGGGNAETRTEWQGLLGTSTWAGVKNANNQISLSQHSVGPSKSLGCLLIITKVVY